MSFLNSLLFVGSKKEYCLVDIAQGRSVKDICEISKNTIYPFKVEISEKDEINVIWGMNETMTLSSSLGTDAKFSATTSVQPEYDSLDDDCIAMSYFSAAGSNIDIFTCVACMHDIDNENFGVTIMASADYSPDYTFHGIAGII